MAKFLVEMSKLQSTGGLCREVRRLQADGRVLGISRPVTCNGNPNGRGRWTARAIMPKPIDVAAWVRHMADQGYFITENRA